MLTFDEDKEELILPPEPTFTYLEEEIIDQELRCQYICHEPLEEPVSHINCQNSFCKMCISKINYKCPICGISDKNEFITTTVRSFLNLLNKLKVSCNNCLTNVNRGDFQDHVKICPFNCLRKCGIEINRNNSLEHENICQNKLIMCINGCKKIFPRKEMNEHDKECPEKNNHLFDRL